LHAEIREIREREVDAERDGKNREREREREKTMRSRVNTTLGNQDVHIFSDWIREDNRGGKSRYISV